MTNSDPKSALAAGDPRHLLPEWLRDPPDVQTEPASATASLPVGNAENDDPMELARLKAHEPAHSAPRPSQPERLDKWQAPPPPPTGPFDPSGLIAHNDLPEWVKRLSDAPAVSLQDSSSTDPVADAPVVNRLAVLKPMDAGDQLAAAVVERTVDGENRVQTASRSVQTRESDLSPTAFLLIAGTTLVLILMALIISLT